jgi:hypothetical protein
MQDVSATDNAILLHRHHLLFEITLYEYDSSCDVVNGDTIAFALRSSLHLEGLQQRVDQHSQHA